MSKRTALYDEHVALGGRVVEFGGWDLPVQYTGLADEHKACRTAIGLFDVSHMGEFIVEGDRALDFLNTLVTNDLSKISDGQAMYTAMCHESGGIVDDLIIYKRSKDKFFVVVNASNTDKDFAHAVKIKKMFPEFASVRLDNDSSNYTQIAVQGPRATELVQSFSDQDLSKVKTYWFTEGKFSGEIPCFFARTGYTGEDGFELYVPWDMGPKVWRALVEKGTPMGLKPCGLGARDTLRTEMKYPLYGHELDDDTTPLESGLAWVTKLDKKTFIGKDAITKKKESGIKYSLIGLKALGKLIPRQGYTVHDGSDRRIGLVTTGTFAPSLGYSVAIARVESGFAKVGTKLKIKVRDNFLDVEVTPTPFYNKEKK
ncbi:MAG: glycine cleavage system aminomethyltransferase GcvT [Xanthomonadaceae bacterium]|nr:glycine cleavage system aminomethyltransferase GcvT [Xanthomonadaceae bacterium]